MQKKVENKDNLVNASSMNDYERRREQEKR